MKNLRFKKVISFVLAIALVFGVVSVSSFAAPASSLFDMNDAETRQGEEFEIVIKFNRDISPEIDPVAALDVTLAFNSEIYSVVSMENGAGLENAFSKFGSGESNLEKDYIFSTSANIPGEIRWSFVAMNSFTFVKGEEFMKIRFKANDLSDLTKTQDMKISVTNAAEPGTLTNVTKKFTAFTNNVEVEANLTKLCDWEYVSALGGFRLVKFNGENASVFTIPDEYDAPYDLRGARPVVSIGSSAFRDCDTITKIVLGKNVAEVGTAAFLFCDNLERLVVFSDKTKFGANSLYGTSEDKFVVKCLKGSTADEYATSNGFEVEYFENVADCKYTGADDAVYYTGGPVRLPNLKVYNSESKLMKRGIDYTVYYTDNVKIGTAKVIVTGKGEYLGTKEIEFKVLCPHHTSTSSYYTEQTVYADCEKDGYVIKTCSFCGLNDSSTVAPAKEHGEFFDLITKDSTCTDKGEKDIVCKDCNKVISTQEVDVKEHKAADDAQWTETKPAECGVAGEEVLYCATCDEILDKREIPALEHNYVEGIIKAPTCKETGLKGTVCTNCGDYYDETVLDIVDHDICWVVTTEAKCEEKGVETYQCRFCGYYEGEVQTREVEEKGHEMGDWVIVEETSCTKAGLKSRKCINCTDKTETEEIKQLDHISGEWIVFSELTCTTDEHKVQYCTVCKTELDVIKNTTPGHKPGEWVTVTELTCTQDGVKERYCTVCEDLYDTKTEKSTGHESGKWETVAATCAKEGANNHYCKKCNEIYESTPIQKLPHKEGKWEVVVEATCTNPGMKHTVCNVCGEAVNTEEIPANNHTYVRVVEKLPSYRFEGKDKVVCEVCGEFNRYIPVKKLSADIDGNKSVTAADALLVLQYVTGLKVVDEEKEKAADLDGNGATNSADALIVLQIATGLIIV